MKNDEFEKMVSSGIASIPPRFLNKLDNVAILIKDRPSPDQLRQNHLLDGETLLGLYEGIPITERGEYYGIGVVMPDTITIFKEPILEEARESSESIEDIVKDTVWHEIAHFFGYDDEEIYRREDSGTNRST